MWSPGGRKGVGRMHTAGACGGVGDAWRQAGSPLWKLYLSREWGEFASPAEILSPLSPSSAPLLEAFQGWGREHGLPPPQLLWPSFQAPPGPGPGRQVINIPK